MIAPAGSPADVAAARELFVEYAESLGFSLCFQGFDEELAGLPGKYASPSGVILLAREPEGLAGCVALRPLPAPGIEGRCEMKRPFVRRAFRGRGLGRALAEEVVAQARAIGYREMVPDTLDTMTEALGLYASLGFRRTDPYIFNPLSNAVYLRLELAWSVGMGGAFGVMVMLMAVALLCSAGPSGAGSAEITLRAGHDQPLKSMYDEGHTSSRGELPSGPVVGYNPRSSPRPSSAPSQR